MGVTRTVLEHGNGDQPNKGDEITVHYTGFVYDVTKECRGECFDSSESRGVPFTTAIGVGKVIRGWDEGIMEIRFGEKSILKISSDYAYGTKDFPGLIPLDSTLELEVQLLGISRVMSKSAPKHGDARA